MSSPTTLTSLSLSLIEETYAGLSVAQLQALTTLRKNGRARLAAFVEAAIDLLDAIDGDSDFEACGWPEDYRALDIRGLPDGTEPNGDEGDYSWPEWLQCA